MKVVRTYTATIYCGLREGYTETLHGFHEVKGICQAFCNDIGLCVSVVCVDFIYSGGHENGLAITLINYPRFPESRRGILKKALKLAEILLVNLKQNRISVVCSNKTYMLEAICNT